MRALTLLLTLIATPAFAGESPIKADWEALLAGDCDLVAAHVVTDIEARVLRNAPYALKGYVFKSAELTALYGADGGWYVPNKDAKLDFTPKEGACIKKIKALEASLVKAKKTIEAKFAERFTANHEAVVALRANTAGFSGGLFLVRVHKTADDTTWEIGDASCAPTKTNPEGDCNVLQLICGKTSCLLNAPG